MGDFQAALDRVEPHVVASPGPLDERLLDEARAELLARLPDEHRALLRRWNGAVVEAGALAFATGGGGVDSIGELWSLGECDAVPHELLTENERYVVEEFLPSGLVAFGLTAADDVLCISLNDADHGRIYLWDSRLRSPSEASLYVDRVAAALSSFPEAEAILADPGHPDYWAAAQAASYASVVEVGTSLSSWLLACRRAEVA